MNVTFSRASTAVKRDGSVVPAGVPRFEAGRFSQAVTLEEGTTNLLTANQASVETDTTGFAITGAGIAISRVTTHAWHGAASLQLTTPGLVWEGVHTTSRPVTPGQPHIISLYLRGDGGNFRVHIQERSSTDVFLRNSGAVTVTSANGIWVRVESAVTVGVDCHFVQIGILTTTTVRAITYHIDGLQIEQKPYPTSWHPGGATRPPEVLTVPTADVVNPTEGTLEFWWQPIKQPASTMVGQMTSPQIVRMGNYGQVNSWVLWVWMGELRLFVRGSGSTGWTGIWTIISGSAWYQLNRWYHIAACWSGGDTFWVFVDGVRYGPYVSTHPFTGIAGNVMTLGGQAASGYTNALFDDLRISMRARTDTEVLAGFSSNAPLPLDADTTAKLTFDDVISNLFTTHAGLSALNVAPSSEHVYRYGYTGLSSTDIAISSEHVYGYESIGQTSLAIVPSSEHVYGYESIGQTSLAIVPSSEHVYRYGYNGVVVAEALPRAEVLPRFMYESMARANIVPVTTWFFAPPPGVPRQTFILPKETDVVFNVPQEVNFHVH